MQSKELAQQDVGLEGFRMPAQAKAVPSGQAMVANIASIVSVASHTFKFRENANTPGRLLEQSVVVNVPPGAGFFCCIPYFTGAYPEANFQTLRERPLGQFFVAIGMRGNNLVCRARLTDSNQDDPIFIEVSAIVVFYN